MLQTVLAAEPTLRAAEPIPDQLVTLVAAVPGSTTDKQTDSSTSRILQPAQTDRNDGNGNCAHNLMFGFGWVLSGTVDDLCV